jgi:hypothetical protein
VLVVIQGIITVAVTPQISGRRTLSREDHAGI